MNTLICPHCGKRVEITQALAHELEAEILSAAKEKHQKELEEAKKTAFEQSTKKIKEQFDLQLKLAREEAQEKDERIKELIEQITLLTKEVRESKRQMQEKELHLQKQLASEEEKIRVEAAKKAEEEHRFKLLEKEKQLQDALKANEDMRRKLQQGSQQTQGEVFELEFESMLQKEFPNDKITPVGKGIKGGDIVQEVWDRNGNYCGKILWELKNTKTWSEQWSDKLKIDQREVKAEYAVIISEVVPSDIKIAGYRKGIWITQRDYVIALACCLRLNLIQVSMAKEAQKDVKEKKDVLYSYLSSTEFRHRVEAIVEAFTNMQGEIEKEKRYFANKWARDEKNIRQVIDNTYGMHGDLKGIMGGVLPQIKGLEETTLLADGESDTPLLDGVQKGRIKTYV